MAQSRIKLRAKRFVGSHRWRSVTLIGKMLGFLGLSILLGLGSAWFAVEKGTALTTRYIGPWQTWKTLGSPQADPYTLARISRTGSLPITFTNALYFTAYKDDEGDRLGSDCEYTLDGRAIDAEWWSLAAYNGDGGLINNKAARHAFSSNNVLRNTDGSFRIWLSRKARSGNWLPAGDAENLILVLRVHGPRVSEDTQRRGKIEESLPRIEKVVCD